MKKWFLFLFVVVLFTLARQDVRASSDYHNFESISLKSGKFLKDYTDKEYKEYYKKVTKRKFYGWKIYEVHKELKVTYKAETFFSYYNDGTTPIKYTYSLKKKQLKTQDISSSGSVKVSISGPIKKFKGGLDTTLKMDYSSKSSDETTEETKLTIDVDPGTMLNLYMYGEGKITNGVAANYLFWIRNALGGYEIFNVTTQYYRLEKVKI